MRDGLVAHPEGEEEAFPEFEGREAVEGSLGGEEGLEGGEGLVAQSFLWRLGGLLARCSVGFIVANIPLDARFLMNGSSCSGAVILERNWLSMV